MKDSRFPLAVALFSGLVVSLQTVAELLLPADVLSPAASLDLLFGLGVFALIGCLGTVWWAGGNWTRLPIAAAIRRSTAHPRPGQLR